MLLGGTGGRQDDAKTADGVYLRVGASGGEGGAELRREEEQLLQLGVRCSDAEYLHFFATTE